MSINDLETLKALLEAFEAEHTAVETWQETFVRDVINLVDNKLFAESERAELRQYESE